jgi:hypothetical protein
MLESKYEDRDHSFGISYDHRSDKSPVVFKIKGMTDGEISGGIGYSF